jgi:two-component system chemotaxis response regulator CheY
MIEGERAKVLIADDEPHILKLISTVMSSMNNDVVAQAKNGDEAVKMFKETNPDITLLDINMPIKDGMEALKEIMTDSPDTFVIMMTSVSDMETVEQCIELGASHYIRKDTPIAEMKEMILEAWNEHNKGKGGRDE